MGAGHEYMGFGGELRDLGERRKLLPALRFDTVSRAGTVKDGHLWSGRSWTAAGKHHSRR